MRLIDADAIAEKLGIGKECSKCQYSSDPYCAWKPNVVDVCEAIWTAPTESDTISRPQWIPVTERLPEDGTWNIFSDGKNISVERYKMDAIDHFFPQGRWFSFDKAIAWMPLPEPYQAERRTDG